MEKFIYGFDIGGSTIKIGLFNLLGDLVKKTEIKTNLSEKGKFILSDIYNIIKTQDIDLNDVVGYGFGVPGPVFNDIVIECVNIGWRNYDLKTEFSEYTSCNNIHIENDANVATLGETIKGAAFGYKNTAMITLGTGVGGGIVLNSTIVNGAHGSAGEIGHMHVVKENGIKCNCGNKGCLETVASATGIKNEFQRLSLTKNKELNIDDLPNSTKEIFEIAKKGNLVALEVIDKVAYYIGYACHIISITTNPDIIIIGGGVLKSGEFLVKKIIKYFNEIVYKPVRKTLIVNSKLGNNAGIYGAASLVISND